MTSQELVEIALVVLSLPGIIFGISYIRRLSRTEQKLEPIAALQEILSTLPPSAFTTAEKDQLETIEKGPPYTDEQINTLVKRLRRLKTQLRAVMIGTALYFFTVLAVIIALSEGSTEASIVLPISLLVLVLEASFFGVRAQTEYSHFILEKIKEDLLK